MLGHSHYCHVCILFHLIDCGTTRHIRNTHYNVVIISVTCFMHISQSENLKLCVSVNSHDKHLCTLKVELVL